MSRPSAAKNRRTAMDRQADFAPTHRAVTEPEVFNGKGSGLFVEGR